MQPPASEVEMRKHLKCSLTTLFHSLHESFWSINKTIVRSFLTAFYILHLKCPMLLKYLYATVNSAGGAKRKLVKRESLRRQEN